METHEPLVIQSIRAVSRALKDSADVAVEFMSTTQRRQSLLEITAAATQLQSLRLRLIATSGDVADADGARDIATWLAHHTQTDRATNARELRLARSIDRTWRQVADALTSAAVNAAQAEAIVTGLEKLADDVPTDILQKAEAHLVDAAHTFGPRELRILARRVLDVVAPELGEDAERRALEAEEAHARRTTTLRTRALGDGTTEIYARLPDAAASRLLTCLHSFTSPRREGAVPKDERLPHDRKLGLAFCSLVETLDPARLPLHGGDATTVIVTVDLATLRDGLGVAHLGPDEVITASDARRLACSAGILPLVLGGKSEPLDLGRKRRLFTPGQRKAMAVRDRVCRASGCEIPAAWCEAHHATAPWSQGGRTNLTDGKLLCHFHHQRAHDSAYHHAELPGGDVRFHRRR
jgi:Domain of unknown function (DUF222)